MAKGLNFKRHRFPPAVIRHAVWLYFRYTLSFRDVEEMLAHRGIEVSYETIRCWTIKFGRQIAASLMICPLLSGPSFILAWATKEAWNGRQEVGRGADYREAA